MKRELILAADGTIQQDPTGTTKIVFGSTSAALMALELTLLREELSESLTIRTHQGRCSVKLRVGQPTRYSAEINVETLRTNLMLSPRELDRWLAFFLRYYRDSVAEVDHLDLEAERTSGGVVDIIVCVPNAMPPVNEEEVRRRLGL